MWKDADGKDNAASQAARAMLDAFTSVGAGHFDFAWTTRQGEKANFRRHVPAESFRHFLPQLLANAEKSERNLIVRPVSRRAVFIQLDDLSREGLDRLKPAAFLGLETSPGNYQAWVAIPAGGADKDFARRLRKGAGADDTASGATRVAGSLNFKDKYAPDFPRAQVAHSAPGLMASPNQLESMGLVAEPEKRPPPPIFRLSPMGRTRTGKWPSYLRCVQGAPQNRDQTGPDVSRADFTWCMTAISWGHGIEETAARLMEESAKARENGQGYALLTAQNAAAAEARNRQRSRA
jgi:hypothetical protein